MKKTLVYEPIINDENLIIEFSDYFDITKQSNIHVPNGFIAVVFINEKILFKVNPTENKKLIDYGKEYLNNNCRIAFVKTKSIELMSWGFGNIQVNNKRLKEAYRVGSNGKYSVDIVEIGKLIKSFNNENITIDMIRERTLPIIKNIGTSILGSFFADTNISVFEISSLIGDFRQELFEKLKKEIAFASLGLELKDITVEQIFIPQDDLELIRNRINNGSMQSTNQNPIIDFDEMYDHISRELIKQLKSEIQDLNNNDELVELSKQQKNLFDELNKVTNQLSEMEKTLSIEFDEKIQDLLPLNDKAKDEYINNITITAENLINLAKDDEDLIPAAAIIYSNVENNLRNKYHLKYERERFIIDYKEYTEIANKAIINGRYLLKRKNRDGSFSTFTPRVIKYNSLNNPQLVEMTPIVRFIKAGLSYEDTKKAAEIWTILNKIRHNSKDNERMLKEIFTKANISRKTYLLNALKFYKNKGLYTKD